MQLYSITTNQEAILALFRVINRYLGNLPPMPGVFPDYPAPVIRDAGSGRETVTMRWGMPPPPRPPGAPVTNIRNTSSPHWRMWLKPENRCLVPANSFAEYAPEPNPETKKKSTPNHSRSGLRKRPRTPENAQKHCRQGRTRRSFEKGAAVRYCPLDDWLSSPGLQPPR